MCNYYFILKLKILKVVSTINHTIPAHDTKKLSIDATCLVCELDLCRFIYTIIIVRDY